MPDRAIAPLEELARQLRGEADWMTPETPPGYQSGRIGQSRLDAERIEFLLPALASRFEALEEVSKKYFEYSQGSPEFSIWLNRELRGSK